MIVETTVVHDENWRGRRILVTGGSGFLGSALLRRLRHWPATVLAPSSEEYDLRNPGIARKMLEELRPDMVIHLAAQVGGIGANQRRPAEFFYNNLMMGVPLFHASWQTGVKKFISVGTVCSYPKHTPVPFSECELWNGYPEETNAPYGLAKKMLLVAGDCYRQQYGFNSIFLLPVNLYGPGDNFDLETSHVIPAIIRKCVEASRDGLSEVTLWGTGRPTREFLYVDDAAEGILLAAARYDSPEPVNLGSGAEISIADLAAEIARATDFRGSFRWNSERPDGQPRRCVDNRRAQERFGFKAATPFTEGLRQTVDWYVATKK